MYKVIFSAGAGLFGLGVAFLAVSPSMFEIREPLILGGLLWSVLGGVTMIIGRAVDKRQKELGALR